MSDKDHSLSATNISFSYANKKALNDVSLQVGCGRFVALLGANGAGKTTLFSIITGLYRAHSGSVKVMGYELGQETLQALANMGVVFQKSTLDMDLTVNQNLRYASELHGMSRSDGRKRITEAIDRHNMQEYQHQKVSNLSGGQKRRVELARALLHNPSLVLLDEPTVGLDLASRAEFVSHVKSLCQSQQTGVLWATHLMEEVALDDDVYILNQGEIVASGTAAELIQEHEVSDVTALFNTIVPSRKT